jgi:uncharacterized protein (TIGR03435 family)
MRRQQMRFVAWAFCLAASARSAAQVVPVFEVVSVRSSPPAFNAPAGTREGLTVLPGGRFEARGQTLAQLAGVAFGFENADPARGMVEAKVEWWLTDRFDVTATAAHRWTTPPPGTMFPAELRTMLRALLEERFGLKATIQKRTVDVTALRLARPGGPADGLRPSTVACQPPNANPSPAGPPKPRCAVTVTRERLEAESVTMTEVAQLISQIPGIPWSAGMSLPFVDQTNLPGRYDLTLSIPLEVNDSASSGIPGRAGLIPGPRASTIAVKGAIETQLGLKLESARLPIPILTIEQANKPQDD